MPVTLRRGMGAHRNKAGVHRLISEYELRSFDAVLHGLAMTTERQVDSPKERMRENEVRRSASLRAEAFDHRAPARNVALDELA